MYYKVLKNGRVIDVLDKLIYLKWQDKHKIMVLCSENDAQAILSSDGDTIWHEDTLYRIPVEGFETVHTEVIDEFEYRQLKTLNGKTPEEIMDATIMLLLERGIL